MKADPKTEAAVMSVLNMYAEAYAKKDMEGVLALLTPDPDLTFIGTDVDEKCTGLAEMKTLLERDFAITEDVSWEWGKPLVSVAGPVAWVSADCFARAKVKGKQMELPMRITAVLERRGDRWFMAQLHNSVPVMRQL